MVKESNQEVPCLRNDVKLEYDKNKGRYLVAVEDIPAGDMIFKNISLQRMILIIFSGEMIITETPYTSVLLPEYFSTHCQLCYSRTIAPIPCFYCARVISIEIV